MNRVRAFILTFLLAASVLTFSSDVATRADQEKSIGVVAGETANQVQDQTQAAYQATEKSGKEAAKEMEAAWSRFSEAFFKQLEQTAKAAQEAFGNLQKSLEHEYEKFKATRKKS